jgi:hypothetical protein
VETDDLDIFTSIRKYIKAVFDHEPESRHDIMVEINNSDNFPEVSEGAKKVKSLIFMLEHEEVRLEIYTNGSSTWYIYGKKAGIWIDYTNNRISISINGTPFSFEYFNVLIFFLHPLGSLLENFGYYRLHSACVNLNGKAVLITGPAESGKSTSAFSIPLSGGRIISDDLVFIKKDNDGYMASSLNRLVKLPSKSMSVFYPELFQRGAAAVYDNETYFFIEDINTTPAEENYVEAIITLEKTGRNESTYKNAHPSEFVQKLFPSSIHTNFEPQPGEKFMFITDMLSNIKCKKVFLGKDMIIFKKTLSEIVDRG